MPATSPAAAASLSGVSTGHQRAGKPTSTRQSRTNATGRRHRAASATCTRARRTSAHHAEVAGTMTTGTITRADIGLVLTGDDLPGLVDGDDDLRPLLNAELGQDVGNMGL